MAKKCPNCDIMLTSKEANEKKCPLCQHPLMDGARIDRTDNSENQDSTVSPPSRGRITECVEGLTFLLLYLCVLLLVWGVAIGSAWSKYGEQSRARAFVDHSETVQATISVEIRRSDHSGSYVNSRTSSLSTGRSTVVEVRI